MRWINLTTVDDYHQAHILGAALEEEGILSMEVNGITATMLPHLRQGITIRVSEDDFLKARVIFDRLSNPK